MAVRGVGVFMAGVIRGERGLVEGGEVAPREDMGGGEGGGRLDAVEEEDLVGWGQEDDARAGAGLGHGFVGRGLCSSAAGR